MIVFTSIFLLKKLRKKEDNKEHIQFIDQLTKEQADITEYYRQARLAFSDERNEILRKRNTNSPNTVEFFDDYSNRLKELKKVEEHWQKYWFLYPQLPPPYKSEKI